MYAILLCLVYFLTFPLLALGISGRDAEQERAREAARGVDSVT